MSDSRKVSSSSDDPLLNLAAAEGGVLDEGHVSLHRLWAFATHQGMLSQSEQRHINSCEECSSALRVCQSEKTFGAVLKKLNREGEG